MQQAGGTRPLFRTETRIVVICLKAYVDYKGGNQVESPNVKGICQIDCLRPSQSGNSKRGDRPRAP